MQDNRTVFTARVALHLVAAQRTQPRLWLCCGELRDQRFSVARLLRTVAADLRACDAV